MSDATGTVQADLPQLTAEDLRQRVEALDGEIETLREVYHSLHAQRQTATLDREGYLTYRATEDRLGVLARTVEGLRPQLEAARLKEAVEAAQQHHDALIPEAQALATAAVESLTQCARQWQALAALFTTQTDPLMRFRDRHGGQALALSGGDADVTNLFASLQPGNSDLHQVLRGLLQIPLTTGYAKEALANCPRLRPFSPRAIDTYLQGVTP